MDGSAFLVPFDSTTGAAAFQSGDSTYVVFDERRPVDMAALTADPVFGSASVQLLPTGTLLRIPRCLPALSIALTQMPQGWRIAALASTPKQQPIVASVADGRINLAAEQPSDVVNMADPDTGATLLVGTQHRPGQGSDVRARHSSEFILRPTITGRRCRSHFRTRSRSSRFPTGFSLSASCGGLALSPPTGATAELIDAAHLTRRLNFSTHASRCAAAACDHAVRRRSQQAPPLSRGPKHRAAAETFLALGLAAEAESLLHMAADQDPKEAASADTEALTAIAALLAGRPDEFGRIDGSETERHRRDCTCGGRCGRRCRMRAHPRAAAVFATTAPLVFLYPGPIRDHILPLIAETMIQGGEIAAGGAPVSKSQGRPQSGLCARIAEQRRGQNRPGVEYVRRVGQRTRPVRPSTRGGTTLWNYDWRPGCSTRPRPPMLWTSCSTPGVATRASWLCASASANCAGSPGLGAWRWPRFGRPKPIFPTKPRRSIERLKDTFAGMIRDQGARQMPPIEFVAMHR